MDRPQVSTENIETYIISQARIAVNASYDATMQYELLQHAPIGRRIRFIAFFMYRFVHILAPVLASQEVENMPNSTQSND